MSAAAEREQAERATQKQRRLVATARVEERNIADRDRFMKICKVQTGS